MSVSKELRRIASGIDGRRVRESAIDYEDMSFDTMRLLNVMAKECAAAADGVLELHGLLDDAGLFQAKVGADYETFMRHVNRLYKEVDDLIPRMALIKSGARHFAKLKNQKARI